MTRSPAHKTRRRPPFFRPVPLRARSDGWSEARQCAFLAALYVTGSVAAAARSVGMTRASAYWLRARAGGESFAHAWDQVLVPPGSGKRRAWRPDHRTLTLPTLTQWVETGLVQPVIHRGRMVGVRRRHDDSTLFRLLRRTGERVEPLFRGDFS